MQEIKIENLIEEITSFYDPKLHHFVCLNANDLGENRLKLQWIFTFYNQEDNYQIFWTICSFDEVLPTITKIIPSAIMSEAEIVDLFGVQIKDIRGGLYLDETSPISPLRCSI